MLALSRCTLLAAAPWAAPAVTFGVPSLVGSSNSSQPDGSDFWFPSITIPTGIRGHVAQVSHFRLLPSTHRTTPMRARATTKSIVTVRT